MARIWKGIAARHSRVKKISPRPESIVFRNENDNLRPKLSPRGLYEVFFSSRESAASCLVFHGGKAFVQRFCTYVRCNALFSIDESLR